MKRGYFVTGTDTNVGKTVTAAMIVYKLRALGEDAGYWKPIQTGTDSDRKTVLSLTGIDESKSPPSCFEFPEPIAPARAAALHQEKIDLSVIEKQWLDLSDKQSWIVEGAGGLLVPLSENKTIADLAVLLNLPLVVVASTRLGTMNHLLLTLEAARSRNLKISGVIWAGDEDPGLESSLDTWLTEIPWQQRIPFISSVDRQNIQSFSQRLEISWTV